MFDEKDYEKIGKNKKHFMFFNIISILFITGITFTFVIPNLKGFNMGFFFFSLLFYFIIANVFTGIFKYQIQRVFVISLVFSTLGMGWRLWLEWGENSLVEHMNPIVYIGYPCTVAIIITVMYMFSEKFKLKKSIIVDR